MHGYMAIAIRSYLKYGAIIAIASYSCIVWRYYAIVIAIAIYYFSYGMALL